MSRKIPKPRRPHDELRPDIIGLAGQIVDTDGLSALTARRLAGAADISVGTIYNLFGHLDGVVRALNVDSMARMGDALDAAVNAADANAEARLIAMAEAYFRFGVDHPHRWEALFRYRTTTPADGSIERARSKLQDRLIASVGSDEDPETLRALWAAVHGVAELAIADRLAGVDTDTANRYIRLIITAGLRGIAALREAKDL